MVRTKCHLVDGNLRLHEAFTALLKMFAVFTSSDAALNVDSGYLVDKVILVKTQLGQQSGYGQFIYLFAELFTNLIALVNAFSYQPEQG